MALKTDIYIYPTKLAGQKIGHIATYTYDPEKPESGVYDSWGGAKDNGIRTASGMKEHDIDSYGTNPIIISLPEIEGNFDTFKGQYQKSIYYMQRGRFDTYNLLANNCAHSSRMRLKQAGYLKKDPRTLPNLPGVRSESRKYALETPLGVTNAATKAAFKKLKADREKATQTNDNDTIQKIDLEIGKLELQCKKLAKFDYTAPDLDVLEDEKARFDSAKTVDAANNIQKEFKNINSLLLKMYRLKNTWEKLGETEKDTKKAEQYKADAKLAIDYTDALKTRLEECDPEDPEKTETFFKLISNWCNSADKLSKLYPEWQKLMHHLKATIIDLKESFNKKFGKKPSEEQKTAKVDAWKKRIAAQAEARREAEKKRQAATPALKNKIVNAQNGSKNHHTTR